MPILPHNPFHRSQPSQAEPPRKLAFVLGGGGPRGALQVGALRALLEAGIHPDMLVGTSIGAINGAFLARFGFSEAGLEHLMEVWNDAARGDFAPGDFTRAMIRTLLPGIKNQGYLAQARAFYARHGLPPHLRFRDLAGPELYMVAADIQHHRAVVFGEHPDDPVLDSMLASAAIPPWLPPMELDGGVMVDGGAVSHLPIEAALQHGATEIIALDLFHPRPPEKPIQGFLGLLDQVFTTMESRHIELELELARRMQTPVHRWQLRYDHRIAFWDLSQTHNLIHAGYEAAKTYLADMEKTTQQIEAASPPSSPEGPLAALRTTLLREMQKLLGRQGRHNR